MRACVEEGLLALLEADGIDDAFALHALQARLDHRPFRRVDHDGHARDIRLAGDQAQELHHRRLRVEHALVHVDVDDLRAVRHLLARDIHGGRVIAGLDQLAKLGRAGHIGALADVDEQAAGIDGERLRARSGGTPTRSSECAARRQAGNRVGDGADVLRRRAAAAAHHVDEAARGKVAQGLRPFPARSRRTRQKHSAALHSDRRTHRYRQCGRVLRRTAAAAFRRARNSVPPPRAGHGGRNSKTPRWSGPTSVRPEASVMVPDTMIGSSAPASSSTSRTANKAAFAFKVSKIVSIRIMSTPPAMSARAASQYARPVHRR